MPRSTTRKASWLFVCAFVLLGVSADAATLDASAGALTYTAANLVVNALTVSLSGGSYTIDDPGEAAISLGAGALAAGCANADANTVTCPESAIGSWNVQLADQVDSANLSAILEPTTVRGGQGNDTLIGGSGADTFTWFAGDASDSIDGGAGADTLDWAGTSIGEIYNISAIVDGFQVTRDVAVVTLQALRVEALILQTFGGDDTVTTHPLPATTQSLDAGLQNATDTLHYDAGGACTTQTATSFQSLGGQLVTFGAFEAVDLANQCTVFPAALEIGGGVLSYTAGTGAANAVAVSLAAGSYTIDDAAVPAITLGAGALAAGCANLDTNTVTCPQSAIAAWSLLLGDQVDTATLSAVLEPIVIRGGLGSDVLTAGAGPDTFLWSPGDASDQLDGGPGADSLEWSGANVDEIFNVSAIVDGFQVTRNIGTVTLQALRVEALILQASGGDDSVTTHPLPATTQSLDAGTQNASDTLVYDAGGVCTTQTANSLQSLGGQLATHAGFEVVNLLNQCAVLPSSLDVSGGQLTYAAAAGAANALTVSLAAGSYTIDDTGEPAITLGSGALAAGCANLDFNTATCPESAISSWDVQLSDQVDSANLSAILEPTTVRGGQGNDSLIGGSVADTFTWFAGDASDSIDGGPGADTLAWNGTSIGETYDVSAIADGFQVTRDVAVVTLQALRVEALILQTSGGDDTVTTRPLPLTTQSLHGGTQNVLDTLVYDADLACTTQGAGSFHSTSGQIVLHTGFESSSLVDQCANPTPVPALGERMRWLLALLLGLAAVWLGGRRLQSARQR